MMNHDEKSELSLLESHIALLLSEKGFSSHGFEKDEQFKEWVLHIPLEYRGERVGLYVSVSCDEPREYRIYPGIPIQSASEFIELTPAKTDDFAETLCDLELYVSFAIKGRIPKEYMPAQDVWIEKNLALPKRFKKEIPLFQVIKEYELRRGRERVTIGRTFCQCLEGTRVYYDSPMISEHVEISEGGIVLVRTTRKDLIEHPTRFDGSIDELKKYFDSLTKAEAVQRTYHNLKRFENKLRELPWQNDLEAIYNGSGSF